MPALHKTSRTFSRIVFVFAFLCVVTVAANAYTVVLHGGRRVEIPSSFTLTASTLTYEVSPGVQVTLNLAAIDVTATEQANNEAPGSFLQRTTHGSSLRVPSASRAASHTITNRDLESSSRRRRESELAYERRRKELGLPSVEASRRQAEAEAALIGKDLEQTSAAERESETYWRARASALRSEIAGVDAELSYVRRQLDEPTFPSANGSFTTVENVVPFPSFGDFGRGPFGGRVTRRPGVFVGQQQGLQVGGRGVFGPGNRRVAGFSSPLGFPRARPFGSPFLAPPNLTDFGSTWPAYDYSYERSQLVTQFNQLAAVRSGLSARWRELEDEARRAGAPPGWLRP